MHIALISMIFSFFTCLIRIWDGMNGQKVPYYGPGRLVLLPESVAINRVTAILFALLQYVCNYFNIGKYDK